MRRLRLLVTAGMVLFLATQGLSQDGGFGRGGRGGGFGRGGFGGGGGGGMDPNGFFDRLSGGKDVWVRAEISNPMMQQIFDRTAQRLGITSGQITREQFSASMQQRMAQGGGMAPGSGSPSPSGASRGGGGLNDPNAWSRWAEGMFSRLDQNGDGYLNHDEMPEELASERDKWDADHNGLIDLTEFKNFFQARMQQRIAEQGGNGANAGQAEMAAVTVIAPPEEEDKRPVVFRVGKLPKELPAWFQQLDMDKDAQVGLYEWKAAGRKVDEFLAMDRNGDGFLTPEEVLAYQTKNNRGSGTNPTAVAANGPGGMPAAGTGMAPGGMRPGGMRMGGSGGSRRFGGQGGFNQARSRGGPGMGG